MGVQKCLDSSVLVELVVAIAKAVTLAGVDVKLDTTTSGSNPLGEYPAVLHRHNGVEVPVQHQDRGGCEAIGVPDR